ncbi:MAG: hypothetical protein KF890_15185, partial [Nitrospira sp.]|nr:hypothetical protein [Nitrospira sp.]
MTEAGWTRELPAKRGFYWYRPVHYKAAPRILEIGPGMSLSLIVLNTDRFYLSQWDGEWLGPISLDSYKQGRVEGAQKALEIVKGHNANGEHQVVVYDLQQLVIEQAAQA